MTAGVGTANRKTLAATGPERTPGSASVAPKTPPNDLLNKPRRFVLPVVPSVEIAHDKSKWVWCVAIRQMDAAKVAQRLADSAASGDVITAAQVQGWFSRGSKKLPQLRDAAAMNDFLRALNLLRNSESRTVAQIHAETAERQAMDLRGLTRAIDTLAEQLPGIVAKAAPRPAVPAIYDDDQILRLSRLAIAAKEARGIIEYYPPPPKETIWHTVAWLMEWHVRRLLAEAGDSKDRGLSKEGPIVKIIVEALCQVGYVVEPGAVAGAAVTFAASTDAAYPHAMVVSKGMVIAG